MITMPVPRPQADAVCERLTTRVQRIDAGLDAIEIKVADTPDELEQAYRILHDVYREAGILRPDPRGVRILPHFLLPSTWTLIARDRGQIVATSTLIGDSELGLPAEDTHPEAIRALRASGARMMESTGLACTPAYRDSGLVFVLLGATFEVMRQTGMTKMMMRLVPRAAAIYQRAFACEPLGEPRDLPGLPGLAYATLALDIAHGEAGIRRCFADASDPSAMPRALFELAPRLVRWRAELTGTARRRAIAALARAFPDVLAGCSSDARTVIQRALAPELAWPAGSSPFLPVLPPLT